MQNKTGLLKSLKILQTSSKLMESRQDTQKKGEILNQRRQNHNMLVFNKSMDYKYKPKLYANAEPKKISFLEQYLKKDSFQNKEINKFPSIVASDSLQIKNQIDFQLKSEKFLRVGNITPTALKVSQKSMCIPQHMLKSDPEKNSLRKGSYNISSIQEVLKNVSIFNDLKKKQKNHHYLNIAHVQEVQTVENMDLNSFRRQMADEALKSHNYEENRKKKIQELYLINKREQGLLADKISSRRDHINTVKCRYIKPDHHLEDEKLDEGKRIASKASKLVLTEKLAQKKKVLFFSHKKYKSLFC